ncbi:hypothetical protein [Vallitalea okinawensis]|uniref:hypothetical protein n=1 Tax=Vallitalea okinawensis TaxID=2078660 RepID=UPI000CFDD601|nr:hypothetical protein [Vallitalea okinawensis]
MFRSKEKIIIILMIALMVTGCSKIDYQSEIDNITIEKESLKAELENKNAVINEISTKNTNYELQLKNTQDKNEELEEEVKLSKEKINLLDVQLQTSKVELLLAQKEKQIYDASEVRYSESELKEGMKFSGLTVEEVELDDKYSRVLFSGYFIMEGFFVINDFGYTNLIFITDEESDYTPFYFVKEQKYYDSCGVINDDLVKELLGDELHNKLFQVGVNGGEYHLPAIAVFKNYQHLGYHESELMNTAELVEILEIKAE